MRGPYRLEIELAAAAIAAGACLYIRFGRTNYRAKIRFGVAAVVPHALALAVLNSWAPQPTTMRPISPITVLILFLGCLHRGGAKTSIGSRRDCGINGPARRVGCTSTRSGHTIADANIPFVLSQLCVCGSRGRPVEDSASIGVSRSCSAGAWEL